MNGSRHIPLTLKYKSTCIKMATCAKYKEKLANNVCNYAIIDCFKDNKKSTGYLNHSALSCQL